MAELLIKRWLGRQRIVLLSHSQRLRLDRLLLHHESIYFRLVLGTTRTSRVSKLFIKKFALRACTIVNKITNS